MTRMMLLSVVLSLPLASAAMAEDSPLRDGFGLIQEGTRLMLRGLREEIDPLLQELQEKVGDLSAYHPPEILPNGDILIRRKVPLEPGEEIEL